MPDSFASFPGQNKHIDLRKKLEFISSMRPAIFINALFIWKGQICSCRSSPQRCWLPPMLLPEGQGLVDASLGSRTEAPQRYTSFEDMDLIYEGVGFDNYDWLQVETVRLAV